MPILRCLLLTCLLTLPALAWNDEGHRTVALVAERQLSPLARQWVTDVLRAHPQGAGNLSDAAGWPDRVRDTPEYHHQAWHYINLPLFLDVPERATGMSGDILPALNYVTRTLKDTRASARDKAIALAWLVHLVGDIHQPLHAANGFSSEFPEGDRGGGLLKVVLGQEPVKLHAFWDAAGGLYWRGANHSRLDSIVDGLLRTHPVDARADVRNPSKWADESHELARDVVYPGAVSGQPLAPEYIARAREVSQDRMALAGYRLAGLLERLAQANAHP